MKIVLRVVALFLFVAALGFWVGTGANRGWTKTSIPQKIEDPVTGIEGVTYQKRFVPGIDLLALASVGALMLAGASFLFRTKTGTIHQTNNRTEK